MRLHKVEVDKTNKRSAHYLQISFFSFTDLSVGLISVLTDIIWRITIAWNAGNVACKVIRFLQVSLAKHTRIRTLIVATIYLQLMHNRYMFRSFTVLQCSHQHCVQPVASDVEVVGYL